MIELDINQAVTPFLNVTGMAMISNLRSTSGISRTDT
jgi:hypothetical protein